jgi:hypothetical protein
MDLTKVFLFLLFFLPACGQKNKNIIDPIINSFQEDYNTYSVQHLNQTNLNSIRNEVFLEGLNKVDFYILKSKKVVFNDINYFHIYFYKYANSEKSADVLRKVIELKEKRKSMSEYGPMSKGYNLFIQADDYLLHLESFCETIDDKEWAKWKSKTIEVCKKHFSKIIQVEKTCED